MRPLPRRQLVKVCLFLAVILVVGVLPLIGFKPFMYVCGVIAGAVGLFAFGMLAELLIGFRKFERETAARSEELSCEMAGAVVQSWHDEGLEPEERERRLCAFEAELERRG